MIGITFALPSESSDLIARIQARQHLGDLVLGKIDAREVAIVHTGVGAKNCNARLELLIHKARPELLISAGFAGAVTEELRIGDLIVAENFSDPALLANALRILSSPSARHVKLFTSTSIIDSLAERNEIARKSGAAAADMETGAIVAVCNAHGIPLLSLRAISDTPTEPLPAPASVLFDIESQRTVYGRLFAYILRDPASALRFFRFSGRITRVRAALTEALVALIREI
jgi:adenosylhomocysteine nucleosidase